MLPRKHPDIIMADANHDPCVASVAARMAVRSIRGRSARDGRYLAFPYNVFEFSKVAIFTHHGHKRKVTNVAEVLATKFR